METKPRIGMTEEEQIMRYFNQYGGPPEIWGLGPKIRLKSLGEKSSDPVPQTKKETVDFK